MHSHGCPGGRRTGGGDESTPRFNGEILFELQNDWTFDSDDPDAEINDLYTTIEPYLALQATPWLSLEAGLVFEPVRDPGPNEDRAFEDEGFYAEQLLARFHFGPLEIYGGKFNPGFGIAWDAAPGVYGVDFAEDYEVTEKIGAGVAYTFAREGEEGHRIAFSSFFADTSVLSNSVITSRGRTYKADGGVSNTEDLSSFAVSLDGPVGSAFSYHFGWRHLAGGVSETEDENGLVMAIRGEHALSESVTFSPLFEVVRLLNADGLDQNRTYITGAFQIGLAPWNIAVSYTHRSNDTTDVTLSESEDDLFQLSGGYEFGNGVGIDIATAIRRKAVSNPTASVFWSAIPSASIRRFRPLPERCYAAFGQEAV